MVFGLDTLNLKMTKKYLLDSCIWRDFYENRFSRSGNPLGKYATDLFFKILKRKDKIIFSEILIKELKRDYDLKSINGMLNFLFLNKTLINIEITKYEIIEAEKLAKKRKVPFGDCLNAIQARNHNFIMVSQDQHYFKDLNDITKTIKPQRVT